MNYPYLSWNFSILKSEEFIFPLDDVGFLYGYGLFETLLLLNGEPIFFEEHFERMKNGAKTLLIPFNIQSHLIKNEIEKLVKKNNITKAKLNLYLTPKVNPNDIRKFD